MKRRRAAVSARTAASRHDAHESFQESVDPGYWPRALGLRMVIAVCYMVLVPAGMLPMSQAWYALSGGTLFVYSAAMVALYARYGLLSAYQNISPYVDTLVVTLAIIALAKPEYPIWMGYFLIIPSLANFHSTRYVMAFTGWSALNFCAGLLVLDTAGRADVNWAFAVIVLFMAVFTALNADIILQSNRKLRALVYKASLTDPLTGLDNRRRFRQVLDCHEGPGDAPLAVVMYDLDNFKQINEECGHVYADTMLIKVANELRACFRDADTVARYGGDEMIVLAHVSAVEDAFELAKRSVAHVIDTVGITISAGVSVYPLSAATLEAAVSDADAALGRAKHGGKAQAVLAAA